MGTTADKLEYLNETKIEIADAIEEKGINVPEGTTFREYANLVRNISGGGGENFGVFDLIIRTQTDFESMYNSPTWLGAKSVCFIGNDEGLEFTRSDGDGLLIPQTVMNIQGLNGAKIKVENFAITPANIGGMFYAERPDKNSNYWISGLSVSCSGNTSQAFVNCVNLINCVSDAYGNVIGCGYHGCDNIVNCFGSGSSDNTGIAFGKCFNIINCVGTGDGGMGGGGFLACSNLTNCMGTGFSGNNSSAVGFADCLNLVNCVGSSVNEGEIEAYGYGFYSCDYLTNCAEGAQVSITASFYNCSNISTTSVTINEENFVADGDGNVDLGSVGVTEEELNEAIQAAIYDSWGGEY